MRRFTSAFWKTSKRLYEGARDILIALLVGWNGCGLFLAIASYGEEGAPELFFLAFLYSITTIATAFLIAVLTCIDYRELFRNSGFTRVWAETGDGRVFVLDIPREINDQRLDVKIAFAESQLRGQLGRGGKK